jgi:hypothetical protein
MRKTNGVSLKHQSPSLYSLDTSEMDQAIQLATKLVMGNPSLHFLIETRLYSYYSALDWISSRIWPRLGARGAGLEPYWCGELAP